MLFLGYASRICSLSCLEHYIAEVRRSFILYFIVKYSQSCCVTNFTGGVVPDPRLWEAPPTDLTTEFNCLFKCRM